MKYLILAKKAFSNYIKSKVLKTKIIDRACKFILKYIFNRYNSIKRMKIDWKELDVIEAKFDFQIYGVKLKLTIIYNL